MAAIAHRRKIKMAGGQTGRYSIGGIFAFSGTGATVTVNLPFQVKVEEVQVTPIGTVASDEILSVNNTVAGTAGQDDSGINATSGSVALVVTRTGAAKTSGLKFSLRAIGY
jgi:hypothetical protein